MPIGEIAAGAALGIILQILHESIKKAKDVSLTTRYILDRLDATILRIAPLIVQIDQIHEEIDESPKKIIEDLKHLLEKAVVLVEAYAELKHRNLLKRYRYKNRIKELEASLRWMVDVDVQVNQWLDIKDLMSKMSDMNTKLDEITRQPTNCICPGGDHSNLQRQHHHHHDDDDHHHINQCFSIPLIDFHIRWKSSALNKEHEFRFAMK